MKKRNVILTALLTSALFTSSIGMIDTGIIQAEAKSSVTFKTKKNLNLRTQANYKKSTRILTKVPKGSSVKRIKTVRKGKTTYAYVSYKNLKGKTYRGYLSNKYFTTMKTSKYVTSKAKNKNYRTTAGMYVRQAPDTNVNNKRIKFAKKGSNVKIHGYRTVNKTKFMYVDFGKYRGYVNAKYLTEIKPQPVKPVESDYGIYYPMYYDKDVYYFVATNFAHIYTELGKPEYKYNIEDGIAVTIYGDQTYKGVMYYKIAAGKDARGWVLAEAVKRGEIKDLNEDYDPID